MVTPCRARASSPTFFCKCRLARVHRSHLSLRGTARKHRLACRSRNAGLVAFATETPLAETVIEATHAAYFRWSLWPEALQLEVVLDDLYY